MGYTHYWTDGSAGERISPQAVTPIKRVTSKAYHQGLIQREHDNPRPPLVTTREVRFNGIGNGACQAFCFCIDPSDAIGHCTTERRPHDAVVMRVLLVLGYWRQGLVIRSDGDFRREWAGALAWFNRRVGHAFVDVRPGFYRPARPRHASTSDDGTWLMRLASLGHHATLTPFATHTPWAAPLDRRCRRASRRATRVPSGLCLA